jgi:heme A synthase
LVSIMTLVLAVWITMTERRPVAKRLGWTALVLVLAQAGLGGFRVLKGYPAISATAHATLAQVFFITLVGLSLYLSSWWQSDLPQLDDSGTPRVRLLASWMTVSILVQLVLGAAFRHGAFGIIPHLIGAAVVTAMILWAAATAKRRFRGDRDLRHATIFLHAFFGIQILLGGLAWWAVIRAEDEVQPTVTYATLTVAHVLGGALTLAAAVVFTLTCYRLIPSFGGVAESSSSVKPSPEGAGA